MASFHAQPRSNKTGVLAFFLIVFAHAALPAHAIWVQMGEQVPLDRLLRNVATQVRSHPQEARNYYLLGRIHSLAFAQGGTKVEVIQENGKVTGFPPYQSLRVSPTPGSDPSAPDSVKPLSKLTAAQKSHLRESVRNYSIAVEKDLSNALYQLGLGWMLEQGAPYAGEVGAPPLPVRVKVRKGYRMNPLVASLGSSDPKKRQQAYDQLKKILPYAASDLSAALKMASPAARPFIVQLLKRYWEDESLRVYRKAYALRVQNDKRIGYDGPEADKLISWEAMQGVVRILQARKDPAEAQALALAQQQLKESRPRGMAVTPIIFPLSDPRPLDSLLDPALTVEFDLSGADLPARWPWVRPNTGILVWDPKRTGKIESGRQLFGSATWWMFFDDGYQALAALDDDCDGWLKDEELKGIAVWQDRNGNGVSDFGEVKSSEEMDITALSVIRHRNGEGVLWNSNGIVRGGQALPTYDWMPQSLP